MKKLILFLLAILTSSVMFAQTTATGHARATIIDGIQVTESQWLQFGTSVFSVSGGTVTVSPAGIRTSTGSLSLLDNGFAPGLFNVVTTPNTPLNFSFPQTTIQIYGSRNGYQLTVNNFKSSVSNSSTPGNFTINTDGTATIAVGATCIIPANQSADVYTGTYEVVVNNQ